MDQACAMSFPGSSSAYVAQLTDNNIIGLPDDNDSGQFLLSKLFKAITTRTSAHGDNTWCPVASRHTL